MRAAFLFLLFFAAGCAHLPPRQPTGLKPQAFWKDQQARSAATEQISGKLSVRYSGKKRSVSGRGRILAQRPQQVRLELRDPLGRLQYVLTLIGKNLVAYYPSQNTAYFDGSSGTEYLRQFMGLDVSMSELENFFVGIVPPIYTSREFTVWEWDPAAGYYRGTMRGTKGQNITAYVDGVLGALRELDLDSSDERIQVTYSDFAPCCGKTESVPVANSVSIQLQHSQTTVEIEWQDIEALGKPRAAEAFETSLPGDVKKIVLK